MNQISEKGKLVEYFLLLFFRLFSKKKDEKYNKINDNSKVNQENNNTNKENLYQRFANKDSLKNTEKPVINLLFLFLFF